MTIRREVVHQYIQPSSIVHLQKTNPQEWVRQFRARAHGQHPTTPVLSEEAMSRETICAGP